MASKLEEIWRECSADCLKDVSESWWGRIVQKYTQETRIYHNLENLEEKLNYYESVKHLLKHPKAVALAIFFNNFDYDPKAADCDARNVASFDKFAEEAGIPSDSPLHQQVVSLLQAAATHSTDEHKTDGMFGSEDRHYFLDIDMMPLGSSPDEYALYSFKVQQEYAFLHPNMYRNLRTRVLENFLQIPNIFATKEFREKYEDQARINISQEVESLKF